MKDRGKNTSGFQRSQAETSPFSVNSSKGPRRLGSRESTERTDCGNPDCHASFLHESPERCHKHQSVAVLQENGSAVQAIKDRLWIDFFIQKEAKPGVQEAKEPLLEVP